MIQKTTLKNLDYEDINVMHKASKKYDEALGVLKMQKNTCTSQTYLHQNIIQLFRLELLKRTMARHRPKNYSIKIELHTAFVLLDSLNHYLPMSSDELEKCKARNLISMLFEKLPNTSDSDIKSLFSKKHINL